MNFEEGLSLIGGHKKPLMMWINVAQAQKVVKINSVGSDFGLRLCVAV